MSEIDLRYFLDDEAPAAVAASAPVAADEAPVDGAPLAVKLERVASTALDKLNEVLALPLPDPSDPSFGNLSRAQTAAANTEIQWRYLRTTWHFLTIDFIFNTVLCAVCAFTPAPDLVPVVHFTAIRYATYAIAWLVNVALRHRSIFRAPQWALLLAIAGCAWLG